jgi:hypothetical protein
MTMMAHARIVMKCISGCSDIDFYTAQPSTCINHRETSAPRNRPSQDPLRASKGLQTTRWRSHTSSAQGVMVESLEDAKTTFNHGPFLHLARKLGSSLQWSCMSYPSGRRDRRTRVNIREGFASPTKIAACEETRQRETSRIMRDPV